VIDLAGVGQALADHPLLGLTFSAASEVLDGTMPFAQTLLTAKSAADRETFDLHVFPGTIAPEEPGAPMTVIVFVGLMKPASRGTLRLRSADPSDAPIIDLGYFRDAGDLPRMIEGVRIARRLSRTRPLADLLIEEQYPGPDVSDDTVGLERAVLDRVETYHHPAGTCHMGPPSDSGAVVDARGSVYGVEGLSVIDASIMPEIPAANTNIPTIMIAERCADWLRQDA
jgi:choline dehydrogenase